MWLDDKINLDFGIITIENGFQLIEVILLIGIILYQIFHTFNVHRNINILKFIFKNPLKVKSGIIEKSNLKNDENYYQKIVFLDGDEDDSSLDDLIDDRTVKISITKTTSTNEIILRINNAINSYLISNYGAPVNFSIIKDIIDREVDVKDEEISQSIPTPLYYGLGATMLGIIFGLLSIPDIDGKNFTTAINALIDGVKMAMIASLTGLFCTTILSSFFYKRAKNITLKDKNEQLSYLQAKLLPELIRAEDTGVSGLKSSLDRFAREASRIANNVNNAAIQTGLNISAQQDVIKKIEKLDIRKVSTINVDLFARLENNMEAFNKFSEYINLMGLISDNLKNFALRTNNIDQVTDEINSTLSESKKLTSFLSSHFEKLEALGGAALTAVDISDSHFREAIDKLKGETDARIAALNSISDNTESTLKATFEDIGRKLNVITEQHLKAFRTAYSDAVPRFDTLDNLTELPLIKSQVVLSTEHILNDVASNITKLTGSINKLDNSLNNLPGRLTNKEIIGKLTSIENKLQKRIKPPINPPLGGNGEKDSRGFFKRLFGIDQKPSVEKKVNE